MPAAELGCEPACLSTELCPLCCDRDQSVRLVTYGLICIRLTSEDFFKSIVNSKSGCFFFNCIFFPWGAEVIRFIYF